MDSNKDELKIIKPRFVKGIESTRTEVICIEDEDSYKDTLLSDCKIEDQEANHVSFEGVIFKNVEFRAALLNSLELTNVRFENCDLSNANLSGAIIHRTEFIECNFRLCQMSGTSLSGIDFSDSDVEGLGIQLKDLMGAIVSPMQAVDFSRLLGLVIKQH